MTKPDTDRLYRFLFQGKGVRGEFIRLESSFDAALANHDYPAAIAEQLGHALAAVTLLSATVKLDGSLILQAEGDGVMPVLVAQATSERTLRGLAHWQEIPGERRGLAELMEAGRMVMTIDATGSERYQGIVALEGRTLADGLQEYFSRSEQLPTRLWLASSDGVAAGLLLQRLPQETTEHLSSEEEWEHLVTLAETVSDEELLALPLKELLHRLYHQEDIRLFDPDPVAFRCSCSREKIETALRGLGRGEAEAIIEERGEIRADCEFCNKSYRFDAVDVAALFTEDSMPESGGH